MTTEEQTEFEVVLVSSESNINVAKEIRSITGLGLPEAREMVVGAPCVIAGSVPRSVAEELKRHLENAGATIEIR
ncbi:50S ribosomal protein L7/L12 [Streptomyces sp. NPDC048361]|uniref:ribosomal protein bL12 n=1 Tax=Streptomyces sp. NPDC048361 TaxID=3154720 RepID=UPI003420B97B